jgi:hypothetical protein
MSVEEALHELDGKLPRPVVALMQAVRRQKGRSKNSPSFLATVGREVDKVATDKKKCPRGPRNDERDDL